MKICIWCKKSEQETLFITKAHTIPKSLGGQMICENVCDECNRYFGNPHNGKPSIEKILKDSLQISRLILSGKSNIGKNKSIPKLSSEYFKINLENNTFGLKPKWKFHRMFLETLGTQFKRGIFKMFLEERERQLGDSLDAKFDFIREYSRYGIGDYPVFHFSRVMIPIAEGDLDNPQIRFEKIYEDYVHSLQFFEFDLFGHVFGIPISRIYDLTIEDYIRKTTSQKNEFYREMTKIVRINDFDIMLSIFSK